MSKVEIQKLREAFRYCPCSGKLFWRDRPDSHFTTASQAQTTNMRWAGKEAFTAISDKGYRYGNLFGKRRKAHGIIWAIVYGEYADQIDHINGDRADNRLSNLRSVTFRENARNQKTAKNNTSGFRGVSYIKSRQRWSASIGQDGKVKWLGSFPCIAKAISARRQAECDLGYHPNHGRVTP